MKKKLVIISAVAAIFNSISLCVFFIEFFKSLPEFDFSNGDDYKKNLPTCSINWKKFKQKKYDNHTDR